MNTCDDISVLSFFTSTAASRKIAAADGERAAAVLTAAGFDSMDDFQGAEVADLEDIAGFSDLPSTVQHAIRELPRLAERCVEKRRRLQPVDT